MRTFTRYLIGIAAVLVVVTGVRWAAMRPSNARDWKPEHGVLPTVTIDSSRVHIGGIRNFSYRSATDFTPAYYDRTFDLDGIASVWLGISVFKTNWRGPAHSFLCFGFDNGDYLAASIEARQEKGESYSMLWGLFRRFEVIYVLGDERDVVGTRAIQRADQVYLYPIRASREAIRMLFVDLVEAADALRHHPKFYNTLTDNCTTLLREHANRVATRKIRGGYRILLPGYADELMIEQGLIDSDLPLEEVRKRFWINEKARRYARAENFSELIRRQDP